MTAIAQRLKLNSMRIALRSAAMALVPLLFATAEAATQQADVRVELPVAGGGGRRFTARIEPGDATLAGLARNRPDRETVRVDLTFDYRMPAGTIAFDELIERVVVTVEDSSGTELGVSTIDLDLIPLNPNRTSLRYSVTLYRPPSDPSGRYGVRVRVYGNYE